jgi:putative oxidoreductase
MKAAWAKLVATRDDWVLTLLRVAAGVVIWPHGAQKLLGWFGGYGLQGTLGFMTGSGIPLVFAWLAIIAEFFGGLGLVLGFMTRVAAFGVFVTMATAVLMIHAKNGFFMNWTGQQKGEGIEYFIYALVVLGTLVWSGGGAVSVDRALAKSD